MSGGPGARGLLTVAVVSAAVSVSAAGVSASAQPRALAFLAPVEGASWEVVADYRGGFSGPVGSGRQAPSPSP